MAKYTTDFKLSVIAYYLNGHSYKQTAKQFNLSTDSIVEQWVKLYQTQRQKSCVQFKQKE
ncbi:MAG: helix-turn-helix domain-containing protein [Moraxella equi]|nr:helix-turn-helix domain-containing protein [Moraxella equi]